MVEGNQLGHTRDIFDDIVIILSDLVLEAVEGSLDTAALLVPFLAEQPGERLRVLLSEKDQLVVPDGMLSHQNALAAKEPMRGTADVADGLMLVYEAAQNLSLFNFLSRDAQYSSVGLV